MERIYLAPFIKRTKQTQLKDIYNIYSKDHNALHYLVKSSYEAKSMSYLGPKQWNMIPQVITKSQFISYY